MSRAISSLPVPLSPVISTEACEKAATSTTLQVQGTPPGTLAHQHVLDRRRLNEFLHGVPSPQPRDHLVGRLGQARPDQDIPGTRLRKRPHIGGIGLPGEMRTASTVAPIWCRRAIRRGPRHRSARTRPRRNPPPRRSGAQIDAGAPEQCPEPAACLRSDSPEKSHPHRQCHGRLTWRGQQHHHVDRQGSALSPPAGQPAGTTCTTQATSMLPIAICVSVTGNAPGTARDGGVYQQGARPILTRVVASRRYCVVLLALPPLKLVISQYAYRPVLRARIWLGVAAVCLARVHNRSAIPFAATGSR